MTDERDDILVEMDEDMVLDAETKKTSPFLMFSLGGEHYCVPVGQVKEVLRLAEVTRVPHTPEFVVGAANLRGEIVAILDIRHFFGLSERENTQETMVVVTDVTGSAMGVIVDKLEGTIGIEDESIQAPLATLKAELQKYTTGQLEKDGNILILLDLERVLRCDEIESLKNGGQR